MAGAQSDVATLRRVVVRHARDAFHSDTAIDRQWRDLNYLAPPHSARAKDGHAVQISRRRVAAGQGSRTDADGFRHRPFLLGGRITERLDFPLPRWRGPYDVFHPMSILSPINDGLSLAYSPSLPVPF